MHELSGSRNATDPRRGLRDGGAARRAERHVRLDDHGHSHLDAHGQAGKGSRTHLARTAVCARGDAFPAQVCEYFSADARPACPAEVSPEKIQRSNHERRFSADSRGQNRAGDSTPGGRDGATTATAPAPFAVAQGSPTSLGTGSPPNLGIQGVVSKSKDTSIKIYNGRQKYNEWAFVAVQTVQAV